MTDSNTFRTIAKNEVARIELDTYSRSISHEDIQVVFQTYVMGYMKATLIVAHSTQGRYYEITYSPHNNTMFIDEYQKTASKTVLLPPNLN